MATASFHKSNWLHKQNKELCTYIALFLSTRHIAVPAQLQCEMNKFLVLFRTPISYFASQWNIIFVFLGVSLCYNWDIQGSRGQVSGSFFTYPQRLCGIILCMKIVLTNLDGFFKSNIAGVITPWD